MATCTIRILFFAASLFITCGAGMDVVQYQLDLTSVLPEVLDETSHNTKAIDCAHDCSALPALECTGFVFDPLDMNKCTLFTGPILVSQSQIITTIPGTRTFHNGLVRVYRRTNYTCSDHSDFHLVESAQDDQTTSSYCLRLFLETSSWDDAKLLCESLGARLPHVASLGKIKIVNNFVRTMNPIFMKSWIGAKTPGGTSKWFHILTGQHIPDNSSLWHSPMMYAGAELCAFLSADDKLRHYGCSNARSTLCELVEM